jgi:hypothetical protein
MAIEIPAFIKEHPYAVGSVVIVGGIVVFYLLSGSSSSAASSGGSNQAAVLQADEAEAQINAGTQQQDAQTSAELQSQQDQQEAQDEQTQASVAINNTNTTAQLAAAIYSTQQGTAVTALNDNAQNTEQANQYLFEQNTTAMQDSVLEDQINSGVVENANNNATAIAGTQIGAGVTDLALGDSLTLAQQQESDQYNLSATNESAYDAEIPYITQNAGDQKNSITDADNQTALFQSILAQGNPTVATSGNAVTASTGAAAIRNTTATNTSIASGLAGITTGLFG